MIKCMIYPYHTDVKSLLESIVEHSDFEVTSLVSYQGWGDNDTLVNFGGNELMTTVDVIESINNCSTVLSYIPFSVDTYEGEVQNVVDLCIEFKRNLILVMPIEYEYHKRYEELFKKNELNFKAYTLKDKSHIEDKRKVVFADEEDLKIPVVQVYSIGSKSGQYNIEKNIKNYFSSNGYNVALISSEHFADLAGDYTYPEFILDDKYKFNEKVLMLRSYIKKLALKDNLNLIIMGVKSGIMPLSNYVSNDFGWFAYLLSQAIRPDYVILNLYADKYKKEYYEQMDLLMKYRFGAEVDSFHISNTKLNWNHIFDPNQRYINIYSTEIIEDIAKANSIYENKPVFICGLNDEEIGKHIETKLAEYGMVNLY